MAVCHSLESQSSSSFSRSMESGVQGREGVAFGECATYLWKFVDSEIVPVSKCTLCTLTTTTDS